MPLTLRHAVRNVLRAAVGALVVWAAFVGLLVAAQAVPDERIVAQLRTAVETGEYGPDYVPDGVGGTHDKFTECVVLGYGLGPTPGDLGLVERAVWAPRLASCQVGAEQIVALSEGRPVEVGPYYRYWSGYSVVTRPGVALLGVTGLRLLATGLLVGSTLFALAVLARRVGWPPAVALVAPLVVSSNAVTTPGYASTHALSLSAAATGTALVALATGRWGWRGAAASAAAAAALFVYVDLLTTPALAWMMAAFAAGAVAYRRRPTWLTVVGVLVAAGAAWPLGYAVMWGSRWLLAAAVFGPDVFSSIREVGRFRVSGEHDAVDTSLGAATLANVETWSAHPTSSWVLLLAGATTVVALVVGVRRQGHRAIGFAPLLTLPVLVVPLWYEMLANHSQVHAFFTYRSVPAAVGVVAAAFLVVASGRREAQPPRPDADAADRATGTASVDRHDPSMPQVP